MAETAQQVTFPSPASFSVSARMVSLVLSVNRLSVSDTQVLAAYVLGIVWCGVLWYCVMCCVMWRCVYVRIVMWCHVVYSLPRAPWVTYTLMLIHRYPAYSTLGEPSCVYGHCVRDQCACWPLVEGERCERGQKQSDRREIHTHVPLSLSSHLLPVCVQLQLMQVGAVTSSACLVVHVTQTKTSASVFHPFMESIAPTPLVRTDQHNQCTGFYICT